ncbi:MAG: hypothetical protein L0G99_16995, partial [Propionibacteriales bacterium]|nr:hypothetical protein [Propionibacteriales bacterium]
SGDMGRRSGDRERYDADPKLSTIIRYALATGARVNIDVSDGYRWAEDSLALDRFNDCGIGTAHEIGPSPDVSFKVAVHESMTDHANG